MKNKISFKLISLILLVSFIVTFISIYIQINNQYNNTISKFESNLDNLKKTQIPVLSQALWNIDYQTIDIFLDNLLSNEKIIYAEVLENDKILKKVGNVKESNIIKKTFDITKKEETTLYKIGQLIIIADLEPLYKDLKFSAINIIVSEIIKMLIVSFLIIFLMKKLLINYLESLAQYAKQLSLDNLDKSFKHHKPDHNIPTEVDILYKSMDTMRLNLIEQIKESEEKNNLLSQQSKMAVMGEMIGNIAHQWRQPLSVITTLSSGLQLSFELGKLDGERIKESTDKIINSANYLSDTINDFRDFFKPNKEKNYFKLNKIFEKTFILLNTQFTNNNITVISKIKEIEIYSFENELIQVIINILNNAKDALLDKTDQEFLIQIDTFLKDENVYICIRDNAGGIPDNLLNQIFEPYFTTKGHATGTGIGLYMSSQIIEKHMKGKLTAKNVSFTYNDTLYKGAEFSIIIPKN